MALFSPTLLERIRPPVRPNVRMDESMLVRLNQEILLTMEPFCGLAGCGPTVVVFGSARIKENSPIYKDAVALGHGLTERDMTLKNGGGPGIMEAASRGVNESNGICVGLGIILPREQEMNKFLHFGKEFKYFCTRKVGLLKDVSAAFVYPGGFGTLDELFEVMNLISKGKMPRIPVVLVGEEFWGPIVSYLRQNCGPGKPFNFQDVNLLKVVPDHKAALAELDRARAASPKLFRKSGEVDYVMAGRMEVEMRSAMEQLTVQGGPYVQVHGSRTNVARGYQSETRELGRFIGDNRYVSITTERTPITETLHATVVAKKGFTAGFYNPSLPDTAIDRNLQLRIPTHYEYVGPLMAHKFSLGSLNFPGAFGTLAGVFGQATLVQCAVVPARPIICIGSHVYEPLKQVLDQTMSKRNQTIDPEDLELLQVTDSIRDAWDILHSYE